MSINPVYSTIGTTVDVDTDPSNRKPIYLSSIDLDSTTAREVAAALLTAARLSEPKRKYTKKERKDKAPLTTEEDVTIWINGHSE